MKVTFEVGYNRGDIVYHRLEENRKGIVKDFIYKDQNKTVEYLVCFGLEKEFWCDEIELSDTPVF